jgi:N-hydroxyarylamine O-acetyltransferase
MLIVERVGRDSRHKIVNRRFMMEARDGELLSERTFESAEELWTVLDKTFGVTPPAPADELLSRITGATTPSAEDRFLAPSARSHSRS